MSSMRIWRCAAHNPTPAPLLRRHAASSARTFSGTFVLLSMAAEFAADGLAFQHGAGPASMNAIELGGGEQLVFFQPQWMGNLFSLSILAPCLSILAWPGMYSVLAPGGPPHFTR
jgi:hypothetical protein